MATSTAYPQGSNMQGIGIGGIMGINSPLPGLLKDNYNPLDMGKYVGNPNYESNPNDDPTYTAFMQSEFAKPVAGGQAMTEVFYGDGKSKMFGDTGSAGQFKKYLESMGIPISQGNNSIESVGGIMPYPDVGLQPLPNPGLKSLPEMPDYTEKFSGYDTKIGGFDNQFKDIMTRLEKLEQGIGAMSPTTPSSPVQGGVPDVYTGNNARGY